MSEAIQPLIYTDVQLNLYVQDVECMAAFYCENFGFKESYRAPKEGKALHIEARLGHFVLGFSSLEAAKSIHDLPLNPGKARSEITLWTNDVDRAYEAFVAKGIRCIRTPYSHNEPATLRVAWFEDPEGNIFSIVSQVKSE